MRSEKKMDHFIPQTKYTLSVAVGPVVGLRIVFFLLFMAHA
jgi:hypothetical protein